MDLLIDITVILLCSVCVIFSLTVLSMCFVFLYYLFKNIKPIDKIVVDKERILLNNVKNLKIN